MPTVWQGRVMGAVKMRNNGISNKVDFGVSGQRQLELAVKG